MDYTYIDETLLKQTMETMFMKKYFIEYLHFIFLVLCMFYNTI